MLSIAVFYEQLNMYLVVWNKYTEYLSVIPENINVIILKPHPTLSLARRGKDLPQVKRG